ncbi:hypothetical protein ACFQ1I_33790 [Kitasatospora arboriphila]
MDALNETALRHLLARAWTADGGGRPVLLLVEGEAGTGKSRLLARLAHGVPVPVRTDPQTAAPAEGNAEGPAAGPALLLADDVHRAPGPPGRPGRPARRPCLASPACSATAPRSWTNPGCRSARTPSTPPGSPSSATTSDRSAPRRSGGWPPPRSAPTAARPTSRTGCTGRRRHRPGGRRPARPARRPGGRLPDAFAPPPRLTALALRRTAALPAGHRGVVHAAAVLGEPATAAELAEVAGLAPDTGRTAVQAALRTAALHDHGDGRYGFRVPLAAAAVRDHLA